MKKLLIIFFLFPAFCMAQNKTGYAQIAANLYLSTYLGTGIGVSFVVGHNIGNNGSFGGGFDLVKYKNLDKITPYMYGDFRYYFGTGIKRPLAYFTLTPGYFFYKDSYRAGNYITTVSGGFLIGAGLGCVFYSGHKTAPFLSVLYNRFPIIVKTKDIYATKNYDVAKISFGIKF